MKFVLFYHAISSCWNNGHAHFLRGVCRALRDAGHDVNVFESSDGWSRLNALADGGASVLAATADMLPGVRVRCYDKRLELEAALNDADVVLVHEWNSPELVAKIGRARKQGGRFTLLFHDTHHRAVSAPEDIGRFALDDFDGVLAFGAVLRDAYRRRGWGKQAYVWHEAADTVLFRPNPAQQKTRDLIWIGNWGDGERSAELERYLIAPVRISQASAAVFGVRYPPHALAALRGADIFYGGWLPNHLTPVRFAEARMTIHVPRGPYASMLPGIPTIRVFEALACGIPLISAPWADDEGLFGEECYLKVSSTEAMIDAQRAVLADPGLAASLTAAGLKAIESRHTCRHRAEELIAIVQQLRQSGTELREPERSVA